MADVKFKWAGRFNVPAGVFGRTYDELNKRYAGDVRPKHIVDVARPRSSPLHKAFDWNDRRAAEKYREHQASRMIRSLVVVVTDDRGRSSPPTRAIVSLGVKPGDTNRKYMWAKDAMVKPETRKMMLEMALAELEIFKERYRDLIEFKQIFDAIDATARRHAFKRGLNEAA